MIDTTNVIRRMYGQSGAATVPRQTVLSRTASPQLDGGETCYSGRHTCIPWEVAHSISTPPALSLSYTVPIFFAFTITPLYLSLYGLVSVFSLLFLPYIHRYQTHHCTQLEGRETPVSHRASPQAGLMQANPDEGQWAPSQIWRQARPPSRRRPPSRPSTPRTNPRPACLKRTPTIASGSSRPSSASACSTVRRSISSAGEETGPATQSTVAAKPAGVGIGVEDGEGPGVSQPESGGSDSVEV
jgi:hypothetical protein